MDERRGTRDEASIVHRLFVRRLSGSVLIDSAQAPLISSLRVTISLDAGAFDLV